MAVSPGQSKQTNNNLRYGPSCDADDSPFGSIDSGVKNYIPGQKTPDTEVNESFLSSSSLSSPGGSLLIPSNIFFNDAASSPSSESEPEDSPTQLEATGMVDSKRKAETPPSTITRKEETRSTQ
jgi:hypothetical protein